MDILWVGKRPETGAAGDEIFDQRLTAACVEHGAVLERVYLEPLSRIGQLFKFATSGLPHDRARLASRGNHRVLDQVARRHRVALVSTEALDALLLNVPIPAIAILHNVTGLALPAMFPRNPLAALAAGRARRWEKRVYGEGRFGSVVVLSRRDKSYLQGVTGNSDILFTPPGMPPLVPLAPGARVKQELLISGTFDWLPKYRDVIAFARHYATVADRLPIMAPGLPARAAALLRPTGMPVEAVGSAIRFGLITDRFMAGHKLKTGYYLANNAIVLSFADVAGDFIGIPDHDFFIRQIDDVSEIKQHVSAVAAEDLGNLRDRLETFKQRCAEVFSWQRAARCLLNEASRLADGESRATRNESTS